MDQAAVAHQALYLSVVSRQGSGQSGTCSGGSMGGARGASAPSPRLLKVQLWQVFRHQLSPILMLYVSPIIKAIIVVGLTGIGLGLLLIFSCNQCVQLLLSRQMRTVLSPQRILLYLFARRVTTDKGKAACTGIDNIGIMPAELCIRPAHLPILQTRAVLRGWRGLMSGPTDH